MKFASYSSRGMHPVPEDDGCFKKEELEDFDTMSLKEIGIASGYAGMLEGVV